MTITDDDRAALKATTLWAVAIVRVEHRDSYVEDGERHRVISERVDEIERLRAEVCCTGEPHTCDQEAIAAAEGRTDRVIEERDALRARLAAVESERDSLRENLALYQSGRCVAEEAANIVRRSTAERIAAWLESRRKHHDDRRRRIELRIETGDVDEHGWASSYADSWAADIRAGAWRKGRP